MSATATVRPDCATTGIAGLDEILGGGLSRSHLYLVQGAPGTGKTTLGLQFLLAGVHQGERVLYFTMAETVEELQQVAASHGWSLESSLIHELSITSVTQAELQQTIFPPSEIELDELFEVLTLVQTRRISGFPLILFGKRHWRGLLRWLKPALEDRDFIDRGDLDLLHLTDDPEEAVDILVDYRREIGPPQSVSRAFA